MISDILAFIAIGGVIVVSAWPKARAQRWRTVVFWIVIAALLIGVIITPAGIEP